MRLLLTCLLTFSAGARAVHPGRVCQLLLGRPLVITDATYRGYWGRASQIPEPHRSRVVELVGRTLDSAVLPVEFLDILSFASDDYLWHGRRVRLTLRLRSDGNEVLIEANHLYAPKVVDSRLPHGGTLLERSASLMLIDVLRHAELFREPGAMHIELLALRRWLERRGPGQQNSADEYARVKAQLIRAGQQIAGESAAARRGAEFSAYLRAKQELALAVPALAPRLLGGPLGSSVLAL